MKALCKIKKRGDISIKTLDYLMVNDPQNARFYQLPKIHNRLYDVSGRPVSSNCGYLDFLKQPFKILHKRH